MADTWALELLETVRWIASSASQILRHDKLRNDASFPLFQFRRHLGSCLRRARPHSIGNLTTKSQMKAKSTIKTTPKTGVKAKDIEAKKSPKGGRKSGEGQKDYL
jgi:hypothetical protein